jgi:hypothetical protein
MNENNAWHYVELHYSGVDSYKKLKLFMDPMWPEYSGRIYHEYGASAYSCTECNNTQLLEAREAATLEITGKISGRCDSRHHYHLIMNKWKGLCEQYENHINRKNESYNNGPNNGNDDDDAADKSPKNDDDDDEIEDYSNSQDAFNGGGDNDNDADSAYDHPENKSSLKKRKVAKRNKCDSAMDWHTTDNHSTYKVHFVAISQPDIGCLHDTLTFLNGFKPSFGAWFEGQTCLAHFCYFPDCLSCIVGCPIGLIRPLREYVSTAPYLNKYKVFSSLVAKSTFIQSVHINKHLESMASHTLVQYVKLYNHPKHDAELKKHILQATTPQQVYEYFLKNKAFQQDILQDIGKILSAGYRVPGPESDFRPSEFELAMDLVFRGTLIEISIVLPDKKERIKISKWCSEHVFWSGSKICTLTTMCSPAQLEISKSRASLSFH